MALDSRDLAMLGPTHDAPRAQYTQTDSGAPGRVRMAGRYLRYLPPCIMSYKLLYHAYVRRAIQTTTPNTTERTERIGFYTNISLYVIHTVWTYYVQIH